MTRAVFTAVSICFVTCGSVLAQVDKYKVTPLEKAACQEDAMSLCSSAYPDEDRLIACMRHNRSQLSTVCRTVFEAGMKRRHMAL